MNYLKEDPLRSGYGDPNFFEEEEFWQFGGVDPELEFVLSFNSWPKFMYPTNFPGVPNQRGTRSSLIGYSRKISWIHKFWPRIETQNKF